MSDPGDVVYGRRAVAEAQRGHRGVRRVLTAAEHGADELTRRAGSSDHQGVVAEVDPYPYVDAAALLAEPDPLIVALDQIQDPQNLGAVCRTAEAAGAAGVVICDRRSASITPAVCKASAGAVEHLRIAQVSNLADWLASAKATEGLWVYGADGEAQTPYTAVDMTGPVVMVFGSEGRGVRPRVASACDVLFSIPLRGRTESLNIAAAASVAIFEARRQRDS